MTKQEAIDLLDNLIGMIEDNHGSDYDSAIRMAIDALKPKWISCSERMPEEREWIGTKEFGTTISDEVYVTIEVPSGERITQHMNFQNGSIPAFKQRSIDVFYKGGKVVAWMPLPDPWKEEEG